MATSTLEALRERVADGMRRSIEAPGPGPERELADKATAEALLEARELFYDREGNPDLLGRSYAYRRFVIDAADAAGIPKDQRAAILNRSRYQLSTLLHERHGDELAERGLSKGSVLDRNRKRRERDNALIRVFGGGGPITDYDDAALVASQSRNAFSRLRAVEGGDAEEVARLAADLRRAADAARAAAKAIVTD